MSNPEGCTSVEEWLARGGEITRDRDLIAQDGHEWLVITKRADTWVVRGRFADRDSAVLFLDQVRRAA